MGKTFSRNNIIWYAFCSKFATFTDFDKIKYFLFKKKQILIVFGKSYFFA